MGSRLNSPDAEFEVIGDGLPVEAISALARLLLHIVEADEPDDIRPDKNQKQSPQLQDTPHANEQDPIVHGGISFCSAGKRRNRPHTACVFFRKPDRHLFHIRKPC